MLRQKEVRHSRDLIEKIEARLSHQRRLVSSDALDEKLRLIGGDLIISMERRLSQMQLQHEHLLADLATDHEAGHAVPARPREGGGSRQPRP
ncbi:hypothetical protein [Beijerinckia sp. L45]|uniref:hypothetical protein n=1 Tax=Beijerinckia sp. L45 TaxID=1641855 RepID=UPI00131D7EC6|nr:hypothetical protein [Beijerinckia sp. L45]